MAIVNPRYRVVTFRLSTTEYEAVFAAAEEGGSRSLSDFARAAVLDRAASAARSEREQLQILNGNSEKLMQMLADLDRRISNGCPPLMAATPDRGDES